MSEKAFKKLSRQYHLGTEQFDELLRLLQAGQSPLYVLRYRKELAANLSVQDLDDIVGEARRLESLEKEKQKILKKLQDQGILNEELQGKIDGAETLRELIDYYVPFRPRKRSRSRQALEQGLEPLARKVFAQEEAISLMSDAAAPHVDPEKGLKDVGEVLDGVFHIVCDWIAEEKSHRDKQRELVREQGTVVSNRTGESAPAWLRNEFKEYFEFESKLKAMRAHQFLRLMRGRRLKVIQFSIRPPLGAMCLTAAELYMAGVAEEFNRIDSSFADMETIPEGEKLGELTGPEFLYFCIRRSLSGILAPILTRELERELAKEAEALALDMVRRRMRSALMTRPMKGRRVLAVCPGYRTGCKLAALDESSAVLESCIVYPHTPQLDVAGAKSKIVELIQKHGLTVAVIGDGTASAETESLLSEIIAESCREFRYAVLDEEAANEYAGSAVAEKELPGMGADIQKAVFLGREFLEPLLELSKVNLRALCPAYYAADIGIAALKKAISRVLGECVAEVGVELNSAPISLLKHVPGLNIVTAQEILGYRAAKGQFEGRAQLREVPKIEEETWRQAVGFVKVAGSTNPLDTTRIHPDNYPVATAILGLLGVQSGNLADEQVREEIKKRRADPKAWTI